MRAFAIAILTLVPSLAWAQAPSPSVNVFGAVEAVSPTSITIKDDAGVALSFNIGNDVLILRNRSMSLSEIQAKDFVASAAIRGRDGKLHSTELRVFPEALRGLGEGQRPMNDERQQTMTNATVTGTAVVEGSNHIKVRFKGGESELVLDPGVPVIRIEQVSRDSIQAGERVRVQGAGTVARRITIQQEG